MGPWSHVMVYQSKRVDDSPSNKIPLKIEDDITTYVNRDINAQRNEYLFEPPALSRWLDTAIQDPRDKPIACLFFNISVMTLPAAAVVFYLQSWKVGLVYLVLNLLTFQERFILGLHYSSHRRLFKQRWAVLNQWAPMVLCPFFGLPSGAYNLHHCVMHHIENNVFPYDASSTEPYQRDSPVHFLHYWLRFLLAIWVELPYYAYTRGRKDMCVQCLCTISCYFTAVYLMYPLWAVGVTWVFLVQLVLGSFVLMLGNWSQHIFVSKDVATMDFTKSQCNYHLTYNCVDHPFNQKTFNDGYHIEHHIHSRRHWSEMPQHSLETQSKYAEQDAVVFHGLDFMSVGVCVFFQRYKTLVRAFVDTKSPRRSDAEIEKMLRSRLVPIIRQPKVVAA